MLFFWLGVFFISSLVLFLFPVYGVDDSSIWMVFLGLGIISNITGFLLTGEKQTLDSKKASLVFLIPLAACIIAFRSPYTLPVHILAMGILIHAFTRKKFFQNISQGLILSGLILGIQTACMVPYFKIAARFHEANILTSFFYWIFKALGISCAYSQETIFVQTPRALIPLVTMWERLGLCFFISFIAGSIVLTCFLSNNKNRFGKFSSPAVLIISIILYSIIRYVFLCVIFIETEIVEIFWKPFLISCSYLPLPFLLAKIIRFNKPVKFEIPAVSFSRKTLFAQIALFFLFFALAGYSWFHDPGNQKQGRVLIDEYYSDWEWTERKLDTEWYGIQSVYNYYCFGDYIRHFFSAKTLKEPVNEKILKESDVFIVKTPTKPFSEKEIAAIVRFVNNGGGLFLVGDHTNVFGTTININPLASKFGIRFNFDATYDLKTSDLHFHSNNTLFRHPAVMEMPYFLYATSCSMYAPLSAEDIMTASNLKTMYMDYSRGGYFPDKLEVKNFSFGLFLQSVGVKSGKGRVIAFSDSTCFSNFYMHIPGKPEYTLGVINWLNRTNHYDKPVKFLCLFIMIVCLGFVIYLKLKAGPSSQRIKGLVMFWGLLGLSTGALLFNLQARSSYALPKEHTPMIKVGFEETLCDFKIPSRKLIHNDSIDYHTFYVWTQRLGYVPTLFSLRDYQLDKLDMVVLVNPEKDFSDKDLEKIENYVEKGGRVLIVVNPLQKKSSAQKIVNRFGLKIRYDQYRKNIEIYDGSESLGTIKAFAPIEGGNGLLFTKDKKPLLATVTKGRGMLAVIACSPSFTNRQMGETEAIPNKHQQFLYKLEFWLMEGLMDMKFDRFTPPRPPLKSLK